MPRRSGFCPKRVLIRLSWDPRNLFNMARRVNPLNLGHRATLFQRQWLAKKETRAYFGSFLYEKTFKKFWFQPRMRTSTFEGSEGVEANHPSPGALAFAPLERRADVVLHRALFVSDIVKAKRAIWSGKVKLNGSVMKKPGYPLKDGDMLQIAPTVCALLEKTTTEHGHEFKNVPFAAPFMFVPEYLDVNYAARTVVFLREPLSRPNRVEIPSPQPPDVMMQAFEYYRKLVRYRKSYDFVKKWQRAR